MASPHRHRQESVTETEAQSQDCVASLFGAWGVETQCRASPGLSGEESACNAGDVDSVPGLGRSPGKGNGSPPLQYPCLVNPIDREAWWAAVLGVAKTRVRLSD